MVAPSLTLSGAFRSRFSRKLEEHTERCVDGRMSMRSYQKHRFSFYACYLRAINSVRLYFSGIKRTRYAGITMTVFRDVGGAIAYFVYI